MAPLSHGCCCRSLLTVLAFGGVIDINAVRKTALHRRSCDPVTIDFTVERAKDKSFGEISINLKPKSEPSSTWKVYMFSSAGWEMLGRKPYWHYRSRIKKQMAPYVWVEKMVGYDKDVPIEFKTASEIYQGHIEKWIINGTVQDDVKMEALLSKLLPKSELTWEIDSCSCQNIRAQRNGSGPPRNFHESIASGPGSTDWEDALKLLELPPKSRPELQEIKDAYKAAARKWHPDKNPDGVEKANMMFKKLGPARDLLAKGS
jgi:hypothetical protein